MTTICTSFVDEEGVQMVGSTFNGGVAILDLFLDLCDFALELCNFLAYGISIVF